MIRSAPMPLWPLLCLPPLVTACGEESLHEVPRPDTTDAEPAVAAAVREARERVLADPASGPAWGELGLVCDAHDYAEEARAAYAMAAELDDDPVWPYLASFRIPADEPEAIRAALETALERAPGDSTILLRLGERHLDDGRPEKARSAFQAVTRTDPRNLHALLGLARVARSGGNLSEALEHLEVARDVEPSHRPVHTLLAQVHSALGEADAAAAAEARSQALGDPPQPPDPYFERVVAAGRSALHLLIQADLDLREGRLEEAVERLRTALDARPDLNEARVKLGQTLVLVGRADEGLELLRDAVSLRPTDPAPRRSLAAGLAAAGRIEESLSMSRDLLAHYPEDSGLRRSTAQLLTGLGRNAEALQVLEGAFLTSGEAAPEITGLLAWLLATTDDPELRDPERSVELAEDLCADDPTYLDMGTLACAYAAAERYDEALGALEVALDGARDAGDASFQATLESWRTVIRGGEPVRMSR